MAYITFSAFAAVLSCSGCVSTEDTSGLSDTTGTIYLTNIPVSNSGRKVTRDEGFISCTDDFGNFIRVEILKVDPVLFKQSEKRGGDKGLISFLYDEKYFPVTYGTVESVKEISRVFRRPEGDTVLFTTISVPKGSVLSEGRGRLDATRVVGVYLQPPYCVFMSTEINEIIHLVTQPPLRRLYSV